MASLSLLFQPPKKWTSQHFDILKLVQNRDTPAAEIVDPQYLPGDQDEEFETLAAEFTAPEEDLVDFRYEPSIYRRNIFHPVFTRLSEAMRSEDWSETSKHAMLNLFEVLISWVEAAGNLHITTRSKILFHIRSCGVRGTLKCEGILTSNAVSPRPLGIFSVVRENDTSYLAHTVSQILLQGVLAYDHNVPPINYTAFVLRMERTVLQLSIARISPGYVEELTHGKPVSETLEVFHSEPYDLCKRDRRREALRLIIGLYRYLSAEEGR